MNNEETQMLCDVIARIAPAQKFDEFTAPIWQPILAKIRYEDAREALIVLAGQQEFIGTSHIVGEVGRIRADRVKNGPAFDPAAYPECDPESGQQFLDAIRDHTGRLADGDPPRPVPDQPVKKRPVAELLAPVADRMRPVRGSGGAADDV